MHKLVAISRFGFFVGSRGCMDDGELLELLADLQGDGWQDGVLQCLRSAHTELQSIHAWYCEVPPAAHEQHAAQNCSTHPVSVLLPLSGWLRLCRDARIRLSPQQLQGAFSGRASPTDGTPPSLDLLLFHERVVRLALALKGNGLDATDVTAVLTFLVHDCLMPFASRDTSSGYSKVLGVKSSLRPFLEQTKATFSGNGTPPPTAHQPKRP